MIDLSHEKIEMLFFQQTNWLKRRMEKEMNGFEKMMEEIKHENKF